MIKTLFVVVTLFCINVLCSIALAVEGRGFSVTGECVKTLVPDRGAFQFFLESLEPQPSLAMKKSTDSYNQLKERVLKLKLKNGIVETTDFSVYEEFDWNNNQRKSKGFRARMGMRVETSDLSRLSELIRLGSELSIKNMSGPDTFVSPELKQKEHESCLEVALKNAKDKAEKLARAGEVKLGPVLSVTEGDAINSDPVPSFRGMAKMEMASSADLAPQVDPRSEKMRVTLRAVYSIK